MINPTITNQLFKSMHDIQIKFLEKIKELEKRIVTLESKLQEIYPDRTTIDFEGADATKVPTGENESDIERLKRENAELKIEVLELRKQLIAEGLL
jgi:uncharacterized protein (UPF0335 family)